MKHGKRIGIGALLAVLTLLGIFIRLQVFKSVACPLRQNTIVFWNNTDKPIGVEFRFSYLKPRYLELDKGMRACLSLVSEQKFESWDSLRYIFVRYGGKKYKFTKSECLNTACRDQRCPCVTRYFMAANLSVNDEVWDQVQKKFAEKDKLLDEISRYLVLSNYGKQYSAWGPQARIQALPTKTYTK